MPRIAHFDSPLLLGFDRIERILDRASKTANEGYPPYNIEQMGENRLRITVAVAGFAMDDLSVTTEDNQLVIRGRQHPGPDEDTRVFLHRGIAGRQFQRNFVLAEGIQIEEASLENGLLHVDLTRIVPEPEIRTIPIKGAAKKTREALTLDADRAEDGAS